MNGPESTAECLYTILLEYKGGTYIAQVRGAGPSEALEAWAAALPLDEAEKWKLDLTDLRSVVGEASLVPLDTLINAWCLSGVDAKGEQLLINVVATAR